MRYATGKRSKAICDRCGRKYPYKRLREEWNGLRTCPTCFEPKHPQLEAPRHRPDPEALRHARPEKKEPLVVYVSEYLRIPPFDRRPLAMVGYVGRVIVVTT